MSPLSGADWATGTALAKASRSDTSRTDTSVWEGRGQIPSGRPVLRAHTSLQDFNGFLPWSLRGISLQSFTEAMPRKGGGGPLGIRRSHLAVGNLSKGPFLREMFRSCSCELSVKAEGAPKPHCSGAFRPLLQHRPEAGFGSGPVPVRDARGAGSARVPVAWIPLRSSSCGLRSSCRVAAVARTGSVLILRGARGGAGKSPRRPSAPHEAGLSARPQT